MLLRLSGRNIQLHVHIYTCIEIFPKYNKLFTLYLSDITSTSPASRTIGVMPKKPKQEYEDAQFKEAVNAVKEKGWSVRGAARIYRVPMSTLYDSTHGRFKHHQH